jgi:hypothetical protein
VGKDRVLSPKVGKTASPQDVIGDFHILVILINLNKTCMTNKFDDVMAQRTDAELVAILGSQEGDYQPAAVEAAQRVFNSRKLSAEKVSAIKVDLQQQKELADLKANEPLKFRYKIFAFFFPGAANFFVSGIAFSEGYDRKAREWGRATLYGFVFYGSILFLTGILRFVFKVNV